MNVDSGALILRFHAPASSSILAVPPSPPACMSLVINREVGMAHPVDIYVGQRLRHRRWLLNMTQQQLASAVGIKFQQIQKYESGANRISASRLWDLSKALDVPAAYFFEGAENEHASDTGIPGQLNPSVLEEKETMELVRAYYELEEIPRKRFLELAKALTSEPVKAE